MRSCGPRGDERWSGPGNLGDDKSIFEGDAFLRPFGRGRGAAEQLYALYGPTPRFEASGVQIEASNQSAVRKERTKMLGYFSVVSR